MTNKEKRAMLIALVLGDGYIYCKKKYNNCGISITHSIKQEDYIKYKSELLGEIFDTKPPKLHYNNDEFPGVVMTKGNKYFRILRKWMYNANKKKISKKILSYLTPKGIAIWYMDDGSLCAKKRKGRIHGSELYISTYISKEENQLIIDYFKDTHDIQFTQVKSKGKYRLRCGTKQAIKFIELVKPFIISQMSYKIALIKSGPILD